MNKIFISGNIGKGSVRVTPSGKTVCNFSVADQIGFGDNEQTQWWECSLWGKRAENPKLTDMLVKGTRVTVTGKAELEPAGDYPAKLKLFVDDFMQIDAKNSNAEGGTAKPKPQSVSEVRSEQEIDQQGLEDWDGQIPF